MSICRGRRLYHGLPFGVVALDLRDPLGAFLADVLHVLGDARDVETIRRRAEKRDRAPLLVAPVSVGHLRRVMKYLGNGELTSRAGCTQGDVDAALAFARGAAGRPGGVPVLVASEEERSVFVFPSERRGLAAEAEPMTPRRFEEIAAVEGALDGQEDEDEDDAFDPATRCTFGLPGQAERANDG
jgi:hypothetical protein